MYSGAVSIEEFSHQKPVILPFKQKEEDNRALLVPAVNITETDTEYLIIIASPGMQRGNFSIQVEQSVMSISVKKEKEACNCISDRCEYDYNDWTRAFALPDDADPLLATASYKEGELLIRIPKGNNNGNHAKATIYVY